MIGPSAREEGREEAPLPARTEGRPPALFGRPQWVASGLVLVALAVAGTAGNRYTAWGAFAGAAALFALMRGLGDPDEEPPARRPGPSRATLVALVLVTLGAAALRLGALDFLPPEPTSDHVEKVLDAVRIAEGARPVFCPTNGGREPAQMYLLALLALLPGVGLDLHSLTLLTALEGTLTVPLLFLAGREMARLRAPAAADSAGLWAAAFGAVSGWHLVLSRLGLRIVLLPAATLLLLILLLRAVREGRRRDWLLSGLVLGLSLHTYQSARFLLLVVAAAAPLAALGSRDARPRTLRNLAACAFVAAAGAAPLARYAVEFPADFWARARTRVLGDAPSGDPLAALRRRLPDLARGVLPALGALHVAGDRSWFQAAPGRPLLDPASGALLLLGLGLAGADAFRRRDRAALLVPAALLVLLLPSAAAAAFPDENPSATRASGALAPALLLSGVALGRLGESVDRRRRWAGILLGGALVAASAFGARTRLLEWKAAYAGRALPHRALGAEAAAFTAAGRSFGNVFVVGVPHGVDDRAVAMEAGRPGRSPGLHPGERPLAQALAAARAGTDGRRPDFVRGDPLLFLVSPRDAEGLAELRGLFPSARVRSVPAPGPEGGFVVVEAPAERSAPASGAVSAPSRPGAPARG
ncbi:MAG: hypothetical protein KBB14_10095 [Thermoanaerobaculia bacterium]|nr:hypothetical protein [Thermoanaerobaculia bacterium]